MANIKRLLLITVCAIFLCAASACSASGKTNTDKINTLPNQPDNTRSIILKNSETADDLNATQAVIQYNGDTVQVSYQEKPGDGNTFLLVELIIEKKNPGVSKFEWGKFYVIDSGGTKFYRHENDTFLESFNFKRIKSTDLTFGRNDGFICFEISKQAAKGKLYLMYDSPEGEIRLKLK
jgi:hypothetical protein